MQAISVADVADELYGLPPGQFTAARDERARQARAAGQREVAAEIKKLPRPTASAWLVNQLARQAPDRLAQLFEVAEELQQAQRTLAGGRLRELSGQRRKVISELLPEAARLAERAGQSASDAVMDEVRATLEAALADVQARAAVRSGRLTRALAYAGLGEVDLSAALAGPAEVARPAPGPAAAASAAAGQGPDDAGAQRAAEQAALRRAEQAVTDAKAGLARAEQAAASIAEQQQFLARRLDHLERELGRARAQDAQLARDARQAKQVVAAAAKALTAAQRGLDAAQP